MRNPTDLFRLSEFTEAVRRPYSLTATTIIMAILLVLLPPMYIVIGDMNESSPVLHRPELALDRAIPLVPGWVLVYGCFYLFLILSPIFIIRQDRLIRRLLFAYLTVWFASFLCFLFYPTEAPRPPDVIGNGFVLWGLNFLYSADTSSNCFPSLHVAHSFVSALACYRVHRGIGAGALFCALLVGISTLYIKQHYVLDVVAGILLAFVAYAVFLRSFPSADLLEDDRRSAPWLTLGAILVVVIMLGVYWVAYKSGLTI